MSLPRFTGSQEKNTALIQTIVWRKFGNYLGNIWKLFGQFLGNILTIFGKYPSNMYTTFEQYIVNNLDNIWLIKG